MQRNPPGSTHDHEQDEANWARDQKERGYYYDDSHGYETYSPEDDESDEEPGEASLQEDSEEK